MTSKFLYYLKAFVEYGVPDRWFQGQLTHQVSSMFDCDDVCEIAQRVNYYCKLPAGTRLNDDAPLLSSLRLGRKRTVYYFDSHEIARYFPKDLRWNTEFGDVNYLPPVPAITKSRPIAGNNSNSVLLKLNKIRHFNFVQDSTLFREKNDLLVFRGACYRRNRQQFLERYFGHPLCNVGDVRPKAKSAGARWLVPEMSVADQLKYKFILSLEGNDVASNLKWIMSSNSIAVMPRPKFETWFMEGTLVPDVHYIEINDDYSNLEEKLGYYLRHLQAAEEIVSNAQRFVGQFLDLKRERLIGILTLRKYFERTSQMQVTEREASLYTNPTVELMTRSGDQAA